MPSVMAIVSKAVYAKDGQLASGELAGLGDVLPMDHYLSTNKGLAPLADGGRLFLVTVRPPDEQLWLVAVLEQPAFDKKKKRWRAASPNSTPVTDISALRSKIKFESGKGISAKKGALGMSLQTPRVLSDADIEQLLQAASAGAGAKKQSAAGAFSAAELPPLPRPKIKAAGGDALLEAVLRDPDDVQKRLVYADALTEQGDPRGEFIVIQCKLAGEDLFFSERNELRLRQQTLLQKHAMTWASRLGLPPTALRYKRGFVLAIGASVEAGAFGGFLDKADKVFTYEPVQQLTLSGCRAKDVEAIAESDWLGRLVRIKLSGKVGDLGARAIAQSSAAGGLRTLNLGDTGVGDKGARALAESPHLRRLEVLALTGNSIGDAGLAALAASPNLARCKALYLARNEIGDSGVAALAASPYLGNLQRLGLGGNEEISDAGGGAIAKSAGLASLRRLELDDTEVDEAYGELSKRISRVEL